MSEYKNATIVRKANIYFDGKVTSRTVICADGEKITLGIMLPGTYNFGTAAAETMEIQAGEMDVLLPGALDWKTVGAGDTFEVPGKSKFDLKVKSTVDYICHYH